ncbi:MAG: hypothetical protein NUV63_09755 [Gallionella sp.]|nr:hypothetical protein [Gallionella sp.]
MAVIPEILKAGKMRILPCWPERPVMRELNAGIAGWVERSDTHQLLADSSMGIAALHPSYRAICWPDQ